MTPEQIANFFELYDLVKAIINSDGTWEEKYFRIFSDNVSGAITANGVMVTWYDSDMTYEENVMAYWDLLTAEYKILMVVSPEGA